MIKILTNQGWTKNEIIYEMQRVFGNDVLILVKSLDDERGMAERLLPFCFAGLTVGMMILNYKARGPQIIAQAASMSKPIKKVRKVKKSTIVDDLDRDELKRKLRNRQ